MNAYQKRLRDEVERGLAEIGYGDDPSLADWALQLIDRESKRSYMNGLKAERRPGGVAVGDRGRRPRT
jgi:hypothetical protein